MVEIVKEAAAPDAGGRMITRSRAAVSALFFLNGLMMGAWAPKIPIFASALQLSEAGLGIMLFVFGIGSLLLMPIAGVQIARYGSSRVVQVVAFFFLPTIVGLTLVHSVWAGAIAIFLFGGIGGAMDVAMNANAVEVERSMRRSIMSSCHAFWSLGCLVGSATGGILIAVLGPLGHALIVAGVGLALFFVIRPMIFADTPHPSEQRERARFPLSPLPWLIGIVALFSMIPEGSILDWGALYLRDELNAPTALSGFAFAAFSLAMAAMRFAGDLVRDRLGAVRTLRICAAISFVGLVIAGQAPDVTVALIGFGIAGIGISNMVPIAFSAGGNIPGLAPGIGLSVVTSLGYSGILFAPSVIGFIAEYTSLSTVYTGASLLTLVVLALSGLARHADSVRGH